MDRFKYINKLLEIWDVEGAMKELRELLEDHPDNINAWFLLAEVVEDTETKKDCYKQIIKLDSNNQQAQVKLKQLVEG